MEHFPRRRHDPSFRARAARWCPASSGLAVADFEAEGRQALAQVLPFEPANATARQVLDDLGESDDPPFWR